MIALAALFRREMANGLRTGGGAPAGVLFFLVVVAMMPLAVGPDLALLGRIGPALLWLAALLAALLGLERMFQADQDDGTLDVLVTGVPSLAAIALVKAVAHWATAGLPLVAAAPLLGLMLDLSPRAIGAVTATLLVGTPALTLIGSVGAALTAGMRRGGLVVPVLVVPLTVPVLVFGVAAANAAVTDPDPFLPPFLILAAITLASAVLAPLAAAAALLAGER